MVIVEFQLQVTHHYYSGCKAQHFVLCTLTVVTCGNIKRFTYSKLRFDVVCFAQYQRSLVRTGTPHTSYLSFKSRLHRYHLPSSAIVIQAILYIPFAMMWRKHYSVTNRFFSTAISIYFPLRLHLFLSYFACTMWMISVMNQSWKLGNYIISDILDVLVWHNQSQYNGTRT